MDVRYAPSTAELSSIIIGQCLDTRRQKEEPGGTFLVSVTSYTNCKNCEIIGLARYASGLEL